jgi:selenide,water dikinase
MPFDLLTTVEYGGCSAKLSALKLAEVLKDIPSPRHERLLVGIETHDDAGVYKLTENIAIIQTVDFFPPICSDPFEFGQIAAANALSDVYAMGGTALTALNLMMFPSNKIPLDVLADILKGGLQKVTEAQALIVGGHTIDDYPPKYGLSVTGVIHPSRIITNARARPGDALILAKPIGTGVIIAGRRIGETRPEDYQAALDSMKLLNKNGALVMQEFNVRCATDITGFGLLGHALKMAQGSSVTLRIHAEAVPFLSGAFELADKGCIPGAAFRNREFIADYCGFGPSVDYTRKMLLCDAQTSGGLFMCVAKKTAGDVVEKLKAAGYSQAAQVGEVIDKNVGGGGDRPLMVV